MAADKSSDEDDNTCEDHNAPRQQQLVHSQSSLPAKLNKSLSFSDDRIKPQRELRRLASWSRYLDARGDAHAAEEAEAWTIDLSRLLLGQRFASGAHSRLYHGIYQGKAVAVKIGRHPQGRDDALDRLFVKEVSVLCKLHHPNVVQLIGACKRPPVRCVVTEYLSGGSLREYVATRWPLAMELVTGMALDIARGLRYLHSKKVVHRDIKSANLVLTDELSVKITDFGVAAFESECDHVTGEVGTYRWMAPELVNRKPHSAKVDVYSFGMVLWEMVTGRLPFHDMTPLQAAYAVVNKNARPQLPPDCPPLLSQLMQDCWSLYPERRPLSNHLVTTLERFQASLGTKYFSM